MNADDLANVRNLTALWRRMGASRHELGDGHVLHASDAWPHRRWFDPDARPHAAALEAAVALVAHDPDAVVPLWAGAEDPLAPGLGAAGLAPGFELLAMQRPRDPAPPAGTGDLRLDDVADQAGADLWTRVASEGFGYVVDAPVVRRLLGAPGVQLLLARHAGQAVGTALIFEDAGAVGVHMLGVPPEHRRRGYARRIMHGVLERARRGRATLVTLQASAAGEPLYASLGFTRRFAIPHWSVADARAAAPTP